MHEIANRTALAALVVAGILTASPLLSGTAANYPTEALAIVQHRQFMLGLLGAGLVLAAFLPALRLAAVTGAILSKSAFLVISLQAGFTSAQWFDAGVLALLVGAGLVLARQARQQARWESRPLLLPEA